MTVLPRSKVYQEMYPDALMMEAFGKLNPTVTEKSNYFFKLWRERRPNRVIINGNTGVKETLKALQLKEPWDYQYKTTEVRFESAEDMAMFKLAWRQRT